MSFLSGESAMALCPGCKVMLHTKSGKVLFLLLLLLSSAILFPALSLSSFAQVRTFGVLPLTVMVGNNG